MWSKTFYFYQNTAAIQYVIIEHVIPNPWVLFFPPEVEPGWKLFSPIQPQEHQWAPKLMLVIRSGSQSVFQFIPNGWLDGFEVRATCRLVMFFHTKLRKPFFFTELALCTAGSSCWNKKATSSNFWHKGESTLMSKTSLYSVALRLEGCPHTFGHLESMIKLR